MVDNYIGDLVLFIVDVISHVYHHNKCLLTGKPESDRNDDLNWTFTKPDVGNHAEDMCRTEMIPKQASKMVSRKEDNGQPQQQELERPLFKPHTPPRYPTEQDRCESLIHYAVSVDLIDLKPQDKSRENVRNMLIQSVSQQNWPVCLAKRRPASHTIDERYHQEFSERRPFKDMPRSALRQRTLNNFVGSLHNSPNAMLNSKKYLVSRPSRSAQERRNRHSNGIINWVLQPTTSHESTRDYMSYYKQSHDSRSTRAVFTCMHCHKTTVYDASTIEDNGDFRCSCQSMNDTETQKDRNIPSPNITNISNQLKVFQEPRPSSRQSHHARQLGTPEYMLKGVKQSCIPKDISKTYMDVHLPLIKRSVTQWEHNDLEEDRVSYDGLNLNHEERYGKYGCSTVNKGTLTEFPVSSMESYSRSRMTVSYQDDISEHSEPVQTLTMGVTPVQQDLQSGLPSWPRFIDIYVIKCGGFSYQVIEDDDPSDSGCYSLEDLKHCDDMPLPVIERRPKQKPIIVPSHTCEDCPLCSVYIGDEYAGPTNTYYEQKKNKEKASKQHKSIESSNLHSSSTSDVVIYKDKNSKFSRPQTATILSNSPSGGGKGRWLVLYSRPKNGKSKPNKRKRKVTMAAGKNDE